MITYNELHKKAERYANKREPSTVERDAIAALLRRWYVDGYMQGFTCAGGIVTHPETEEPT